MKDGHYFRLYESQFERYGKTFEESMRGQKTINTIEPINIQHVAAIAHDDYAKDPKRIRALAPFLGPSVFSDGLIWKRSRALVKPIFARAELSDIHHLAMFADRFIELLPSNGTALDIQPLLHRLFLDVSTDFLFGRPMNALQPVMPAECTEFLQAFMKVLKWAGKRREAGWTSFRHNFNKEWRDSYSTVHRYINRHVERALKEIKEEDRIDLEGSTARKRYVLLDELAKHIRDPVQLRYQVQGVFLPAHNSTSVLVGNVLFELARHPHIWTRLRRDSLQIHEEDLSFEKLKTLTEFRYVILETIRLIGPAARVVRVAIRNTFLPLGGGLDGTNVSLGIWSVQHDRDIWGEDVQEFKPERWKDRKVYWEFVPFSGVPRICPAQQQVLTHAIFILLRLTQRFESIENHDSTREYLQKFTLTFESRNGVKIALRPAPQN